MEIVLLDQHIVDISEIEAIRADVVHVVAGHVQIRDTAKYGCPGPIEELVLVDGDVL